MRRPSSSSSGSRSISSSSLAEPLTRRARWAGQQARVAADLAQLQQGVQDGDAAARHALARRWPRAPACPWTGAMPRTGRAAPRPGRRSRRISVFGGSSVAVLPWCGAAGRARRAAPAARGARGRPASRWGAEECGGSAAGRRGSRAAGSRTAPTARPGGSPSACRSGRAGGGRRACAHHLGGLGARVLDGWASSRISRCQVWAAEPLAVARQQRIGGQHQVVLGRWRRSARAGRAVQHQHPQRRREALRLAPPVADQAGGRDHQAGRSSRPASFFEQDVARVCTVLPRPMSSARMPPRSKSRRNCSQSRPWRW
jgi:hypothetical protein